MRATRFFCLFLTLVSCQSSSAPLPTVEDAIVQQWKLPAALREISGLALTGDERLLAVTDELGIVYELDYQNGRLLKAFALGDPVVAADFEGIAVLNDKVWLMTSAGVLYSATEGDDGERVPYRKFETALRDECEFEGLTEDASRESLLLLCKKPGKSKKAISLFEWNPASGTVQSAKLPRKAMARAVGKKRVRPSGLEKDPATGDLIVVASAQTAVYRLSAGAEFIELVMRLPKTRHRQTEGIAITKDGLLLLADEANGEQARLAVYRLNQ